MKKRKKSSYTELNEIRKALDRDLIEQIAPIGGCNPYPNYIEKSDGYECTLYVHDFAYENVPLYGDYFKFENCVTYFQLDPIDVGSLRNDINQTLEEYEDRLRSNTIKRIDKKYAQKEIERLSPIADLMNQNESFFHYSVRIVVAEKTLEKLDERVRYIIEELKKYGYQAVRLMNEQANENQIPFKSLSQDKIRKRRGKEVPTGAFGGAYPFNQTSHNDERGVHIGYTSEMGQVILDIFHKSKNRTSYNGIICGLSGTGKTTFLSKLAKYEMIIGNKLRVIDPVGQFAQMIHWLGGEVISLDGSKDSKILNPLERSKSLTEDESDIESTVSKAETFMRIIAPDLTGNEIALFSVLLKPLYDDNNQPLFEDVLNVVKEQLKMKDLSDHRRTQLENLETQLKRIVNNYGRMFNVHSTLDTTSIRGVCFVMRELIKKDQTVFQAQLFNVLSHLWNELVVLGKPQLDAYNRGELKIEDVEFYCVMMDESHHILNTNNPYGVKYCSIFLREARKYFGGLLYATQRIKDIVKGDIEKESELANDLSLMFEMTQYKFIFNENQNSLSTYRRVFDGQLKEEELSEIPKLQMGEFMMCINGESAIKVITKDMVSQTELEWFGGGA